MLNFLNSYTIEILRKKHNRDEFDCGILELNNYLRYQAGQDVRRKVSTIWAAINKNTEKIAGYYTLSMATIPLLNLDESIQKKLPRYGNIPAVRLGRLAVDKMEQGKGLGKYLISDAMIRCLSNEIAWAFFIVDAKNDAARQFYKNLGFFSLKGNPNNLYIPRSIIEKEYLL